MKTTIKTTIAITFIWIGFVCAISFMEAWLKFQAPNITIALGLGIGQLVFRALNKVELFMSAIIVISILFYSIKYKTRNPILFFVVSFLILLVQTFWLLPELNKLAKNIILGIATPKSKLHFVFIALEIIKVVNLFLFGKSQFKLLK
jgi:hypothetical protein